MANSGTCLDQQYFKLHFENNLNESKVYTLLILISVWEMGPLQQQNNVCSK